MGMVNAIQDCKKSVERKPEPSIQRLVKKRGDLSYKVIVLGDVSVGKTTLVNYTTDKASISGVYSPTVNLTFSSKKIELPNSTAVDLQIWDTPGQEMYRSLVANYYRDSDAVILVFDYSRPNSLDGVYYWIRELDKFADLDNVAIFIAANKCDFKGTERQLIFDDDIEHMKKKLPCKNYKIYDTSGLTGENVNEIFFNIADYCYRKSH